MFIEETELKEVSIPVTLIRVGLGLEPRSTCHTECIPEHVLRFTLWPPGPASHLQSCFSDSRLNPHMKDPFVIRVPRGFLHMCVLGKSFQ